MSIQIIDGFEDGSFTDSVVKTNALQTLKQFGIDEVVSV